MGVGPIDCAEVGINAVPIPIALVGRHRNIIQDAIEEMPIAPPENRDAWGVGMRSPARLPAAPRRSASGQRRGDDVAEKAQEVHVLATVEAFGIVAGNDQKTEPRAFSQRNRRGRFKYGFVFAEHKRPVLHEQPPATRTLRVEPSGQTP